MRFTATDSDSGGASSRIDIGFTLEVSGFADVRVNRTVTLPVSGESVAAEQAQLARRLDREHAAIQLIGRWLLRIAHWKKDLADELELLLQQDVAMYLDVGADESQLTVTFRAEYMAGSLKPLVHPVSFPMVGEVPSEDDMIRKLDDEWAVLRRIFTLARVAGDGLVTKAVPPPFVDSKERQNAKGSGADRDMQPLARVATQEEAKKLTERYLDVFRFPIEVEENGVRYGFIPRVEICAGGAAIKLTVTMLMPPTTGRVTFMMGGSKSVELPISEIYVRGEELNRRTQEGILELVKGLCRSIGREKGMTRDIDITRPHY